MAIDRRWLRPGDAIDCALRRMETSPKPSALECELATQRPDEPVVELVRRLAAAEPPQDDERIARKWMRLALLWVYHRRAALDDPLELVEEVWCEFEHPAELNRFIRYMPAADLEAVKRRSREENLAVLRGEWERYMEAIDRDVSADRRAD